MNTPTQKCIGQYSWELLGVCVTCTEERNFNVFEIPKRWIKYTCGRFITLASRETFESIRRILLLLGNYEDSSNVTLIQINWVPKFAVSARVSDKFALFNKKK